MLSEYEQNLSKENDSETDNCHSSEEAGVHRKHKRSSKHSSDQENRVRRNRGKYFNWRHEKWSNREITTIDEDSV